MRERARDRGRLQDMLEYTQNAMQFAEGVSYEEFLTDRMRYFAIMKNIEIIGEAANMLTNDFRNLHPELPWNQIIGMRHVLVHGYAQISDLKLWRTVTKDLPPLYQFVSQCLSNINWEDWEK
ncbi:MAG: DUF86 domain-containing protein [Prevotella sp.]|nr:DUF86 domain-containing protein [Prevotella sp.]